MAILLSKSKTIKVADSSHFILPEKRKPSAASMERDKRKDAVITNKAKLLIASSLYPLPSNTYNYNNILTSLCPEIMDTSGI